MSKIPKETVAIRQTILSWLKRCLDENAITWLTTTADDLMRDPEDWQLFTSFSLTPRHTGKGLPGLTANEIREANRLRKGWDPSAWTADQAGRTFLLLSYAEQGEEEFLDKIEKIFITSDLGEAVALYQALPVYPFPEKFKDRAAEGVRSNITTVFNGIALNNPYPMDYLDEGAWNQVVLKALFVGSPLYKILGVDTRANATLAKILVEYAHERWSAGRSVSPELWRPVGPFIKDEYIADIQRVLDDPDPIQKQAAVLALSASKVSDKEKLLRPYQSTRDEMVQKNITWDVIGRNHEFESH